MCFRNLYFGNTVTGERIVRGRRGMIRSHHRMCAEVFYLKTLKKPKHPYFSITIKKRQAVVRLSSIRCNFCTIYIRGEVRVCRAAPSVLRQPFFRRGFKNTAAVRPKRLRRIPSGIRSCPQCDSCVFGCRSESRRLR